MTDFSNNWLLKNINSVGIILLLFFVIAYGIHAVYRENQLQKYGVYTIGKLLKISPQVNSVNSVLYECYLGRDTLFNEDGNDYAYESMIDDYYLVKFLGTDLSNSEMLFEYPIKNLPDSLPDNGWDKPPMSLFR
ncbi:MAG: hypothetical protein R8N23_17505 [Reichenbachiella sp.]|uniref:hypothetical protein n=1 Tax=Reichenbachiella sp. TaxID=2184521 RepID=UPI0029661A71|nr:hypothetical protein [Reichenbachiella sp.]MDW3211669.1 hypothetical protein [Reichenbachiella sp.]